MRDGRRFEPAKREAGQMDSVWGGACLDIMTTGLFSSHSAGPEAKRNLVVAGLGRARSSEELLARQRDSPTGGKCLKSKTTAVWCSQDQSLARSLNSLGPTSTHRGVGCRQRGVSELHVLSSISARQKPRPGAKEVAVLTRHAPGSWM